MERGVILLTGGTGKLGRIFTEHLLRMGHRVAITGRDEARLDAFMRDLAASPEALFGFPVDFTAPSAVTDLVTRLSHAGIHITGLVNNARSRNFLEMGADGICPRPNFIGELLLDVVIPYELTMRLAGLSEPTLKRVVNIGSQYGLVAANPHLYDNPAQQSSIHYGVAKAALVHLTKELSVRLAARGMRVNCLVVGGVAGRVDTSFEERYARLTPIGRMLQPHEANEALDFLLSDGVSGMTGQTLVVDGGWTVW